MPEYAPPNSNISIDGMIIPSDNVDGLAIIYRKVKTVIMDKTRELILLGFTDDEIEQELQDGKIILPTGDEVGLLAIIDILGPMFDPSFTDL